MSSTNLTALFTSINKFSGTNWVTFKKDIQVFFQLDGTWDVVSGDKARPSEAAAAAEWDRIDKRGYSLLYFLISPDYRSAITKHSSGSVAWKALRDEYEKDSSATRLTLRNQFYTIRHDPSQPVSFFIESIQSIARQLEAIGHAPGKNEVEDAILLRLNPSFEPIRSSLITQDTAPTILQIVAAIKQFEANQNAISASQAQVKVEEFENEALAAQRGGEDDFDWGNSRGKEGVCFRCGRRGHVAAKCVADMPPGVKAKILHHSHVAAYVAENSAYHRDFDDVENVALASFSVMDDSFEDNHVSSPTIFDSGSARSEGVQLISSGKRSRIRTKRKAGPR